MFRQLSTVFSGFLLPLLFLGSAGPSSAQPASPSPTAHERTLLAESFTKEKLWMWQKRLNLQDWDVSLEVVRSTELKPKTLGNIHWDTDVKSARIAVLSPMDYTLPYKEMLDDMEFTVVHEMVHLQLASLPRSDASRRVEEHAVNEIAKALLKLARH